MNEPSDEARDPHLREALRHAPDADLQAPPQLSELILKEARAKARDPRPVAPVPAPGWVRSVWDWLARPAVATGFAGVMAATLVGLMWWDQPMDEALPRSPVPAAAPQAQDAAAPMPPAAPAVVPPSPSADTTAPRPKPEPARKKAAAEAPRVTAPGTAAPARSGATDAPITEGTAGAAAEVARPAPMAAAPIPVPPPSPAPATVAAPPPSFADAKPEALAKARAREEEHKRERSSSEAPAEALSRRAAAKAQLNESRVQREAEAYTRVASVRAAVAAEPARWTWQRGSRTAQPLHDALVGWLAQLDSAAGTRWQPHQPRDGAAPPDRELVLLRDGQVQHRFQFTEQGVLWDRGQSAWQVELRADQIAALRSALDSAAP